MLILVWEHLLRRIGRQNWSTADGVALLAFTTTVYVVINELQF